MGQKFDISLRDSQYTPAGKIEPENFDIEEYVTYEQSLLQRNEEFQKSKTGLQVYRRMRADGVFYNKSKDYKESLALQLGVLKKSIGYKADVANFLEPWYGIGYIASSFGGKYIWEENQAPAVDPMFKSARELLNTDFVPIHQSQIGKEILNTIEYFLDKTKGKIPMSYTDIQAPINMLSYLIPINDLCMEVMDDPEQLEKAAELVVDLLIEFLKIQEKMIGDCLAKPGHGFASSRVFNGAGESSDNVILLSDHDYKKIFQGSHEKMGDAFGGIVFHSCGDWGHKAEMVKNFRNIITVDAAISPGTDPNPSNPEEFKNIFRNTGITVNARCVGEADSAYPYFEKLISRDMKVIAVTYCQDEKEQARLYDQLHALAKK